MRVDPLIAVNNFPKDQMRGEWHDATIVTLVSTRRVEVSTQKGNIG